MKENNPKKRFEICKKCVYLMLGNVCKQCGCIMRAKVHIKSANCPKNYWIKTDENN